MSWLRAVMLLALIVWIGGIIFFSFVVAPTLFGVLTRELAGNVVSRCLGALHWIGLVAGLVFLLCSIMYNQMKFANPRLFSATHLLQALRAEMHSIDNTPAGDSRRVEFNRLHAWSTRAEGGVLMCGLVVVLLTARRFGN
jgi:hypothetical protein